MAKFNPYYNPKNNLMGNIYSPLFVMDHFSFNTFCKEFCIDPIIQFIFIRNANNYNIFDILRAKISTYVYIVEINGRTYYNQSKIKPEYMSLDRIKEIYDQI